MGHQSYKNSTKSDKILQNFLCQKVNCIAKINHMHMHIITLMLCTILWETWLLFIFSNFLLFLSVLLHYSSTHNDNPTNSILQSTLILLCLATAGWMQRTLKREILNKIHHSLCCWWRTQSGLAFQPNFLKSLKASEY